MIREREREKKTKTKLTGKNLFLTANSCEPVPKKKKKITASLYSQEIDEFKIDWIIIESCWILLFCL